MTRRRVSGTRGRQDGVDEGSDVVGGGGDGLEGGGEVLGGEELCASAFGGEEGRDAAGGVVELVDEDGCVEIEGARNVGEGEGGIGEELEQGWGMCGIHTLTVYKLLELLSSGCLVSDMVIGLIRAGQWNTTGWKPSHGKRLRAMQTWADMMVELFRPDLTGEARDAAIREMRVDGDVESMERNAREAEVWMRGEVARKKGEIRAKWNARARNRLIGDEYPSAAVAIVCWISSPLWCVGAVRAWWFDWKWSRRLARLKGREGAPSVAAARQVLVR